MRQTLVVLLAILPLAAQTTLGVGSLRGTIVDDSDRQVPRARVTLIETSKGLVRNTDSAIDGSFLFASLLAGKYSVRVEMPGFVTQQMDGLRIDIGQEASVDIRLQVGEVRTSITVVAPGRPN